MATQHFHEFAAAKIKGVFATCYTTDFITDLLYNTSCVFALLYNTILFHNTVRVFAIFFATHTTRPSCQAPSFPNPNNDYHWPQHMSQKVKKISKNMVHCFLSMQIVADAKNLDQN